MHFLIWPTASRRITSRQRARSVAYRRLPNIFNQRGLRAAASVQMFIASRAFFSVDVRDYNTYGARRGNDEIMRRGTFANSRIINKTAAKVGPKTLHVPSGKEMDIYDAAQLYAAENSPLIVLAGSDYGSGSSRDWAAKGPLLLGVRAVIAVSFERIHRSNLCGMGLLPLQFSPGENADSLGLSGRERFSIPLPDDLHPGQILHVEVWRLL